MTENSREVARALVAADRSRRRAIGHALGALAELQVRAYRERGIISPEAPIRKGSTLRGVRGVRAGELPPGKAPNWSRTRPVNRTGDLVSGAQVDGARSQVSYHLSTGRHLRAEVSGALLAGPIRVRIHAGPKIGALDWKVPAFGTRPRKAFARQWQQVWSAFRREVNEAAGWLKVGKFANWRPRRVPTPRDGR